MLLSALLQAASLLRVAGPGTASVAAPLLSILRFFAGVSAVAGSYHAVSAATGLTVTGTTTGTNGVPFAGARVSVTSSFYGVAKSYSATGLPPGLSMSKQGVVTGTPNQAGSFRASVTGWKSSSTSGHSYSSPSTFLILAAPATAPVFGLLPVPVSVNEGETAIFSSQAGGSPPPAYQWWHGTNTIPGATNASLQILKTTTGDSGSYSVIAFNSAGSVTSAPVSLTVIATLVPEPVTITSAVLGPGGLNLEFPAQAGVAYVVEYIESVPATTWKPLTNLTAVAAPAVFRIEDPIRSDPRYYRVRDLP